MSQKVPSDAPAELDPKQLAALESLLTGATSTAAAKAAGVNRRTLWRWIRFDIQFQAALNGGRREARRTAEIRIDTLAESAISVVRQALDLGDVRTALAVLRGRRLLDEELEEIGSGDPDVLATQAREQERTAALNARMAEFRLPII